MTKKETMTFDLGNRRGKDQRARALGGDAKKAQAAEAGSAPSPKEGAEQDKAGADTFVTTVYIPTEVDQAFRLCLIGVNARRAAAHKRTLSASGVMEGLLKWWLEDPSAVEVPSAGEIRGVPKVSCGFYLSRETWEQVAVACVYESARNPKAGKLTRSRLMGALMGAWAESDGACCEF